MSGNSFGRLFQIHSFGESHGPAMGVVIDGCPAGVAFDEGILKKDLERRRPGFQAEVSQRREEDSPQILSGIYEGRTLGTPIAVIIVNQDARSDDYKQIQVSPRPGHADDVWQTKFGHVDHRGGGRASGRETVSRVIGGAFAKMLLREVARNLEFQTFAQTIGPYVLKNSDDQKNELKAFLVNARANGESYGGVVECRILNPPASLGEPVFQKLKSELTSAMMSIGATAFVEMVTREGDVSLITSPGTLFHQDNKNYSGIRGGISTGEEISFRVGFKPTSSILDTAKKGRHDPCIVPARVPVVEAMAALVLADLALQRRLNRV